MVTLNLLNLMMTNHISNVLNVIENILADMMNYFHTTIEEVKGQIEADAEAYIKKSLEDAFKGNNFFKIK